MVEKTKQVYIFQNEMYPILKIGVSDDPMKRIKAIQNAIGFPLNLMYESEAVINPVTVEKLIHLELKEYRKFGEWFDIDVESAIKVIEEVLKTATKGEYKDLSKGYQLEDTDTIIFDYNVHNYQQGFYDKLIEDEPFIYRNQKFYYFIVFKQGKLEKTIRFCNKWLALKFKKENLDRLI